MTLAIATFTFTACEDVPEPYPTPTSNGGSGSSELAGLPFTSANLNTGWTLQEVTTGAQPWSKGTSYAQATGYQAWDGGSTKSNKAVEGWLVSPAISTVGVENVKLSFNHTIRYSNNVSGWEANHKVYASTSFDGSNASTATWKELSFKPVASPYTDWTLYSSGEIQLPAEFVGQETVYIGFWFKAPANASTTWELQAFKIEEGIAQTTEEPTPQPTEDLGTADAPLTVAKALEIINGYDNAGESKTDAYVKGKIVSVASYNSTYKSITYYISDDGTATNQLQVYSGKGLNGADFSAKGDLSAGATVVVKGKLKKYVQGTNVTPEINQSSQIISIEGNTPSEPTPQPATNLGTADAPTSVAAALAITKALTSGDKTETAYVKGIITKVAKFYDQYHQIDYYIADAQGGEELMVYNGKNLGNTDFASIADLKVGDEVVVTGQLTNFNGTSEFARGNYIVSINGSGGSNGGGEQGENAGGLMDGNTISVDFTAQGYDNAQEMGTVTLTDGTKLTFDGGGNTNSPKYYNSGTAIRMYPKNTMTVTASKTIVSIQLNCSANNAEGQITATPGNVATDDMTVIINSINSKTTQIANTHTGTGATSQLRFSSMVITYAE